MVKEKVIKKCHICRGVMKEGEVFNYCVKCGRIESIFDISCSFEPKSR